MQRELRGRNATQLCPQALGQASVVLSYCPSPATRTWPLPVRFLLCYTKARPSAWRSRWPLKCQ